MGPKSYCKVKGKINKREARQRWYPRCKLWLDMNVQLLTAYQRRFIYKVPCFDSDYTGYMWMREIMDSGSDVRCVNAFRMERHVLQNLCDELETYGLKASLNMTVLEKVGVFLFTIAHAASNRNASERFQRSGDTISRVMHQVSDALVGRRFGFKGLVRKLLQPRDRKFTTIPTKIQSQERYGVFKGAIGCIDGTHITACIPEHEQYPYFGRKKYCSFNVMSMCDFDMYFTFVSTGWEGSAHDARVFDHAIKTSSLNFPHPPTDRYYLLDKGYPDREGYMVPYSKVKYHKSQFKRDIPKNVEEGFNRVHSSLRTTIERCFGVLKKIWKLLHLMPNYSIQTQNDFILAYFGLHNFILQHKHYDALFEDGEDFEEVFEGREDEGCGELPGGMGHLRAAIAREIWRNKSRYL